MAKNNNKDEVKIITDKEYENLSDALLDELNSGIKKTLAGEATQHNIDTMYGKTNEQKKVLKDAFKSTLMGGGDNAFTSLNQIIREMGQAGWGYKVVRNTMRNSLRIVFTRDGVDEKHSPEIDISENKDGIVVVNGMQVGQRIMGNIAYDSEIGDYTVKLMSSLEYGLNKIIKSMHNAKNQNKISDSKNVNAAAKRAKVIFREGSKAASQAPGFDSNVRNNENNIAINVKHQKKC